MAAAAAAADEQDERDEQGEQSEQGEQVGNRSDAEPLQTEMRPACKWNDRGARASESQLINFSLAREVRD